MIEHLYNIIYLCVNPILIVLDRITPYKIYALSTVRIGHLALNNDLFFRRINSGYFKKSKFILIGPGVENDKVIANKTLYGLVRDRAILDKKIIFIENYFLYWLLLILIKVDNDNGRSSTYCLDLNLDEVEFSSCPQTLFFPQVDIDKGLSKVKDIGVDLNKKIVCIFARDSSFLQNHSNSVDYSYHDYRNADIDTYIPSIDYLIKCGFFVVRIGSVASKPVKYSNNNFLDYSMSNFQSDFLDIFLVYISDFVIGTTSGITDVATIFNTPFLGVNYAPFMEFPLGRDDIFIQKKMTDSSGNVIPFRSIIDNDSYYLYDGNEMFNKYGIKYIDNSPTEILDATIEMVCKLKKCRNQTSTQKKILKRYHQEFCIRNKLISNINSTISTKWLEDNKELYLTQKI